MSSRRYDAVLFDLLTALLDSWTLWNAVAGDDELGRRWRAEYLRITYRTGGYRPYEALVAEAAEAVGLPRAAAGELDERYGELKPWPGVPQALQALAEASVPLGIVTNCSERLGRIAAACIGVDVAVLSRLALAGQRFARLASCFVADFCRKTGGHFCEICLVTAERAGFYKPDPRTYQLGLREIGVATPRCLFVAGSPYDLVGTGAVELPTYWHDRSGMAAPADAPAPLARATTLDGLPAFVLG